MIKFRIIFFLILIIFLLLSCNLDKYFGYSNEAEDLLQYVKIKGKVTNYYTGKPAAIVHVNVRKYETLTDNAGEYNFVYILTADDERNRTVQFRFTQEKYYPEEKNVVIDPLGMEVNISMRYAAPIIKDAALFPDSNASEGSNYICQAIIMDYQGIFTMKTVEATIQVENSSGTTWEMTSPMILVSSPSDREGYFQARFFLRIDESLQGAYRIYARDNEGFEETLRTSMNPFQLDNPIF